jgi:hypothetical protein
VLGYPARLADRVDAGVATLQASEVARIAAHLQRPPAEIVWAGGGRVRRDVAPGVGLRAP